MALDIAKVKANLLGPDFVALAWKTFFGDRDRGVDMATHFPWLWSERDAGVAFTATINGRAAAMLVLRDGTLASGSKNFPIAGIGLVCTAAWAQGQGIASQLLSLAAEHAEASGAGAVLLWSGLHGFYERMGYEVGDRAAHGYLRGPVQPLSIAAESFERSEMANGVTFPGPRGVPSFAREVQVYRSERDEGTQIAVMPGQIPTILGWIGSASEAAVLAASLSAEIGLNAPSGDALHAALVERGWSGELTPLRRAMWLPLAGCLLSPVALAQFPIDLLDRF